MNRYPTWKYALIAFAVVDVKDTVIVEPTAASACAAVHKAMAEAYTTLRRDTHFALNSVLTAARDFYCPYCGEPVVRHV